MWNSYRSKLFKTCSGNQTQDLNVGRLECADHCIKQLIQPPRTRTLGCFNSVYLPQILPDFQTFRDSSSVDRISEPFYI